MQPSVTVEGRVPAYWQADVSRPNDSTFVLTAYIMDEEAAKKLNEGAYIGLSIGTGFQEGRVRFTFRERLVRIRQNIGFWLEGVAAWLQRD